MADRFYRCSFESTYAGITIINTFCIFGDDAFADFTPLTAQGLADKLGTDTALVNSYKAIFQSGVTIQHVIAREMLAPGDLSVPDEGLHDISAIGTGTTDGRANPPELTLINALHTNAAVRSGHGYMAIANTLGDNQTVGSLWDTANWLWTNVGLFNTQFTRYLKGGSAWGGGSHWGLGVYSRRRRQLGLSQFAFSVTGFTRRPNVRWRESRQSAP